MNFSFSLCEVDSLLCRAPYICYISSEVTSKVYEEKGSDVSDFVVVITWKESTLSARECLLKMNFIPDRSKKLNRACDLLLPFPALEIINPMNYQISLSKLSESFDSIHSLRLEFMKWMIPSNWDDAFENSLNQVSIGWKAIWPSNLSPSTVEKLIPSLLHDYPLQHNATIVLKILDGFMVSAFISLFHISIFRILGI
jgi:hypothetical protein